MSATVRILVRRWPEHELAIRSVRNAVFTGEQGIDAALDFDGSDEGCLEALAVDVAGTAVGTGRVTPSGHVGRMAVLAPWRGQGIGARLLDALVAAAFEAGAETVSLNAQCDAAPFYARQGFAAVGEPFEEVGIAHVRMERRRGV